LSDSYLISLIFFFSIFSTSDIKSMVCGDEGQL